MINYIISFSIKNKLFIVLLTMGMVAAGIWSIGKVPLDAVPDITNNQVQIITRAPNLGTEDIEQFVTTPVEISMANLPDVTEIRSISRFGLSVVTIVFKDEIGTYLPRQLVAEKLTEVQDNIPARFGKPFMGPISTGLGEVYQYTLEVDSAHAGFYSASDLRTYQDWIVSRQMAMVPGVIEVSGIGGLIKQYEVAVNPDELKALGITLLDIYNVLEANNENTGGAYIEKDHKANFIRGEGLARSISDIENIVVKNLNGIPIRIKDVAAVGYGNAVRYGALTENGEGDAVGGLVLMLKGVNSNDVVENIKSRISEIQKSLPEGVTIEPTLDRSKLISQTTSTVGKNLLEGALIVIFVLVFLLGNWRGGLIVASTIPLSLLFAFILMNYFGVWANLMSLGAIDFGVIVDGAVIIVESTVFLLYQKIRNKIEITPEVKSNTAQEASSKMMNAAFFGQLIILLVFVPILALEGVEGKMFKPMALTFIFAMIGVMILCLTYVPMMASWAIKIGNPNQISLGDKFVKGIENFYQPILHKAIKNGRLIILFSLGLLILAGVTFKNMGGEFMPKLNEGDLALHAILKPGSSLSETIAITTKVEKLIMNNFPEVEKVVCRIGVAEVPTDPMPMDLADVLVIMKPIEEWTSASTRAEFVEKLKKKVMEIPGINYEFTQPIEMRFNELLAGVREDVAIKLYGEDLDLLASKAQEVASIIAGTDGIGDMHVEATKGLPQMTVNYNRKKLAQYGLNVSELNTLVESAFAGRKAGVIFEGEKRFDLVVRLDKKYRKSINDIKHLFVQLPNGAQIPLQEVADISYKAGFMQISRDNTNRRIYVGINVRGRDVKSLVEEIKGKLAAKLDLPPGYYIRYGGAFENLERATNRLQLVVPVALGLIFILIYFALSSFKQTTMIYMAIPLSAIGGVFSLWLRDMPFSISAGIGFIVLFGIAVLNGLVLISGWNELKANGVENLMERIQMGAKRRIRPILLTAVTDILGFLPMAISSTAGAEVQRPLATVVIGGMISATLLTLFVLPILYQWVEKRDSGKSLVKAPALATVFLLLGIVFCVPNKALAQIQNEKTVTSLDEAIKIGMANNGNIRSAKTNVALQKMAKKGAWNLGKTDAGVRYGQYNSAANDFSFEINQSIEFPTVYSNQKNVVRQKVKGSEYELDISENLLTYRIRHAWFQLSYLKEKEKMLLFQDSIYTRFLNAAKLRYEVEASSYLEMANAETKVMEVENVLRMHYSTVKIEEEELRILLNDSTDLRFDPQMVVAGEHSALEDSSKLENNPMLLLAIQKIYIAEAEKMMHKSKIMPDLTIGYFNQSMIGTVLENKVVTNSSYRFTGVQANISIPIFYGSYKEKVQSAKLNMEIAETEAYYFDKVLKGKYYQAVQEIAKYKSSLDYYNEKAVPQANLIISNAQLSIENGAISYIEYFQNLKQAMEIKFNYLEALNGYNQSVVNLEYLVAK